ncbi:MAG: ROK family protein, partial [Verrucomicrobiota bacterium]
MTNICKDLLSQGALYELEPGYVRSEVGLAAEHWGALAVRLEAGSVAVAIVDHQGKTYGIWRNPFDRSTKPSAMVKIMAGVVAEALEGAAASSFPRLAGIGVSVPGMVNPNKGVCLSAVNLDHWENVPVGQMLVEWLPDGAPGIVIENDAVAALLANRWFLEGGTSVDDVLYFSVGEGVGCAQLAGGHINRGRNFAAGEIGCLPAGKEGRPCRCGKVDCLQVYCSEAGVAETLAMG